jgi:hypothetical protein
MGTTASKPDVPKADTKVAELKKEEVQPAGSASGIESTQESQSGGGCPMKQSDGSYSYDWKAMFQKHPHGPKGSKPLEKESLNTTGSNGTLGVQERNSEAACPVKQYNVYSQPIDPTNQIGCPAAYQRLVHVLFDSQIVQSALEISSAESLSRFCLFCAGRSRQGHNMDISLPTNVLQRFG